MSTANSPVVYSNAWLARNASYGDDLRDTGAGAISQIGPTSAGGWVALTSEKNWVRIDDQTSRLDDGRMSGKRLNMNQRMCIGGSIAFLVGAIGNWIWGSALINVFEIMLTRIPGPLPDSPSRISVLAVFTVILSGGLLVLCTGLLWKGGDRGINLLGRIAYPVSAVIILLSVLLNLLAQFSARNIFYVMATSGSTPREEEVSAIFDTLFLSIPSDYLLLLAGIVMVAGAVFGFARVPRATATFGIASAIMGAIMSIVALIICASMIYAAVCGMDINSTFTNGVTPNPAQLAGDLVWINRMAIVSKIALGVSACVLIIAAIIAPGKSVIPEVAASR